MENGKNSVENVLGSGNLFSRIQASSASFTQAEQKVAAFVLEHPDEVLYMSITDLADACSVGDTSVFRFCRTLRLQGYQQFKMVLAQSMKRDEGIHQHEGVIGPEDPVEEVCEKVLSSNISALRRTHELLDPEDIARAVDWMEEARRVVFFGVGASFITAMEAAGKFMRITNKVSCVMDSHLQAMTASLLEEGDLSFLVSYSGSTKDIVDIGKQCKSSGARTVGVTRYGKSPLGKYSDMTLLCGADEGPLQGGSLSVKLSQLYLLDVLYIEYYKRTYERSNENKQLTTNAVAKKLY